MPSATINQVRWGDRQRFTGVVGAAIITPEFFRVTSPFPCVWRIIALAESGDPGLPILMRVYIGIGSAMGEYLFATPGSTTVSFELPGQSISGRFETGNFATAAPIILDARIAPVIPWEGLQVHPV